MLSGLNNTCKALFVFYKLFGLYYISIEILYPRHLFHNINGIHRRFYLFFKVPFRHHVFYNICVLYKNRLQCLCIHCFACFFLVTFCILVYRF